MGLRASSSKASQREVWSSAVSRPSKYFFWALVVFQGRSRSQIADCGLPREGGGRPAGILLVWKQSPVWNVVCYMDMTWTSAPTDGGGNLDRLSIYSSSSYSSSAASSAAASSSPSGVSGSPAFLPGRTPNHFGSFLAGRFETSANFSFHMDSSHSARITSAPPSYSFLRSPYVLVSVLRSYLENMWMVGGCFWVKDSGSRPFLMALFLSCSFCLSASSLNS